MSCNDGVIAYIGLGSNLGDSIAHVKDGLRSLNDTGRTRVLRCSSLYRSAPVGRTDQPDFINAVCEVETSLDPMALLHALLDVERQHGRIRDGDKGGPRTLDLDLLLYGERELQEPGLDLPHPRLHERAFVLLPMAELAPQLMIPGRGTVQALAEACRDQRIERLPGGGACEPVEATRQCRT